MLSQPHPSLIPGEDLDVREISLRHLVSHLDVLGGQDDHGGAREIFEHVAVAAVIEEADGGVEAVTNCPGLVTELRVGTVAAE